MRVDIDALYKRAKANLWVEDVETRTWLEAIWFGQTFTIQVLVARGRDSVQTMCKDAEKSGHRHVFGLVDRDFGTSNHTKWSSMAQDQRVYKLNVNEFENLLLSDVDALLNCSMHTGSQREGKRPRAEVERRITEGAKKRIWWVTCIQFLAETQRKSKNGYPADPIYKNIQSLSHAEDYVSNSTWFKTTARDCPNLADPAKVKSELQAMYTKVEQIFQSGQWKEEFPGKEMFKEISSYLNPDNSGLDFIKSVGERQRENAKDNKKPLPLAELRKSIEDRVK